MKKILSIVTMLLLCAAGVMAASPTWSSKKSDSYSAKTTLLDNEIAKVETVYAATCKSDAKTINDFSFQGYTQVRVDKAPSTTTPTGTEKSGNTPIVITPKQDLLITIMYRRQGVQVKEGDVVVSQTYDAKDGKDLKIYDQANPTAAINSIEFIVESKTDDEAYGYSYQTWKLEAGKVYTACASGTTICFYGFNIESLAEPEVDDTLNAPTIKQFNGTVGIESSVEGATIQYQIGTAPWKDYTIPFTLFENSTVSARVKVGENVSEVTSAEVVAVEKPVGTRSVLLDYGSFNISSDKLTLTGKDDYVGYSLEMSGDKEWSNGSDIKINGTQYKSIKLSNGLVVTLHLPDNVKAKRITLYSYINDNGTTVCYWSNVNGTKYNSDIPMGSKKDGSNPDVRVYALDDVTGSITFQNAGKQLCFVIALDVIDADALYIDGEDWISFSSTSNTTVPAGAEVYYVSNLDWDNGVATLTQIEDVIPANEGVIVFNPGEGAAFRFTATEDEATAITNALKATGAEGVEAAAGDYILAQPDGEDVGFYPLSAACTLKAHKAYLPNTAAAAPTRIIIGGETSAIKDVIINTTNNDVMYNIYGQRVNDSYKGLVIKNGKKIYNK